MKSKLLLSLSFLTAIFSVNADNVTAQKSEIAWHAFAKMNQCDTWKKTFPEAAAKTSLPGELEYTKLCIKESGRKILANAAFYFNAAKVAGLVSAAGYVGYKYLANKAEAAKQAEVAKEAEVANTAEVANNSWYTKAYASARDRVVSAYSTVETASVNAYDVAKKYTVEKPYHVATGAVAAAALVYGAYSLCYGEVATN